MSNIILLSLFLVLFILVFSADPSHSISEQTNFIDFWEKPGEGDKSDISLKGLSKDFFKMYSTEDIQPKLIYRIDLGKKEKSRRLIDKIFIKSFIDPVNNIGIDKIEILFVDQKISKPDLPGQEISLALNTTDKENYEDTLSVIKVTAPGWELFHLKNSYNWWRLSYKKSKPFGNMIRFFIRIERQDLYKGRELIIYNRDAVELDLKMLIGGNYLYTSLTNSLPYSFLAKEKLSSIDDYFRLHTRSSTLSKNIIGNTATASYWITGEDYKGNDISLRVKPEKIIKFDYSYDYQEDVNLKIVEENKKATSMTLNEIATTSDSSLKYALWIFVASVSISAILAALGIWFSYKLGK